MDEFINHKTTFGTTLRFTPYSYAKLLYMQAMGDTEVAGYCITGTDDPLLVTDFKLIKQQCTSVEFDLDKDDMAEYQEAMTDEGLAVWQSSRILAHTHPGNSPNPSLVEEENFKRSFTIPDWAIMFIIADSGDTYCRMKINVGPGVVKEMDVVIDWSIPFGGSDVVSWASEYEDKVTEMKFRMTGNEKLSSIQSDGYVEQVWPEQLEDEWHDMASDAKRDGLLTTNKNRFENLTGDELEIFWERDGLMVWDDDDNDYYYYCPVDRLWFIDGIANPPGIRSDELDKPWVGDALAWAEKNPCDREQVGI